MHPSGDYNKNAGEDRTQRGGYQIRTPVYRTPDTALSSPHAQMPTGHYHCVIKSKDYFFQILIKASKKNKKQNTDCFPAFSPRYKQNAINIEIN